MKTILALAVLVLAAIPAGACDVVAPAAVYAPAFSFAPVYQAPFALQAQVFQVPAFSPVYQSPVASYAFTQPYAAFAPVYGVSAGFDVAVPFRSRVVVRRGLFFR